MRTIAKEISCNRRESSDLDKQAMVRKKTLLVIKPAEAIAVEKQAIGIELEPKAFLEF